MGCYVQINMGQAKQRAPATSADADFTPCPLYLGAADRKKQPLQLVELTWPQLLDRAATVLPEEEYDGLACTEPLRSPFSQSSRLRLKQAPPRMAGRFRASARAPTVAPKRLHKMFPRLRRLRSRPLRNLFARGSASSRRSSCACGAGMNGALSARQP